MSVLVDGTAQVILDTLEYGSAIKKTPVVVGNCTGFAVNRVFFPYTQVRPFAHFPPTTMLMCPSVHHVCPVI